MGWVWGPKGQWFCWISRFGNNGTVGRYWSSHPPSHGGRCHVPHWTNMGGWFCESRVDSKPAEMPFRRETEVINWIGWHFQSVYPKATKKREKNITPHDVESFYLLRKAAKWDLPLIWLKCQMLNESHLRWSKITCFTSPDPRLKCPQPHQHNTWFDKSCELSKKTGPKRQWFPATKLLPSKCLHLTSPSSSKSSCFLIYSYIS